MNKLKELDSWLRSRLRYCIWKNWKKPERKRKNLSLLGVDQDHAYAWSRTRMGGWAVAQSPILKTTITIKRLEKRGYSPMLDYYLKVSPQFNEPLYTRPGSLPRGIEGYSGVRGAPRQVLAGPSTHIFVLFNIIIFIF